MDSRRRRVLLLRGGLFLLGVCPWLLALAGWSPLARSLFAMPCHQLIAHTLHLHAWGGATAHAMVVCSRCAGIYLGIAVGTVALLPRRWLAHGRALLLLALAVNLLDAAGRWLGFWGIVHPARLLVGGFLGWVMAAFMFAELTKVRDPGGEGARGNLIQPG